MLIPNPITSFPGDRIHVPYYKKVIYVFGETLNPGTYVLMKHSP